MENLVKMWTKIKLSTVFFFCGISIACDVVRDVDEVNGDDDNNEDGEDLTASAEDDSSNSEGFGGWM